MMHLAWSDQFPGGGERAISTSLTGNEAAMLVTLCAGRRVLEIGSAYGFSTVTMAAGGATHVTAVDPHTYCPGSLETLNANLRAYEVQGRVTVITDTFFNAAELLRDERFDFAFLDGDHKRDTVKFDFTHARELLAPGGVIACHDYDEDCCPGVRQALDELRPEGPFMLTDTLAIYGFGGTE